jgi:hypothetical protein
MRRREFITLLGGAASVWPVTARAQQRGPARQIAAFILAGSDTYARFAKVLRLSAGSMARISRLNIAGPEEMPTFSDPTQPAWWH